MTFETDFIGALNVSGVTSLVPLTRITATKRIQNGSLPAITFERITSNPVQSIAGDDTGLDQVRMRINCWADDYKEARQIRDAVRVAMRGLTSYFINDQDLYEDDTQIYRVAMDFYVWARVPRDYDLTANNLVVTPSLGTPTLTSANWTPASLDAGNLRAWFDAQDLSVLWQDSALSTPVTGDAEPVGGWVDKPDGNKQLIQATAGNRGTTGSSGGLRYVEFDGVSDILRGITASDWSVLHGPLGGGIYVVAEWTTASGGLTYNFGTSAAAVSTSSAIGLRGMVRAIVSGVQRPAVVFGNGSSSTLDDGVTDSWPIDTVKMVKFENDYPNTTTRVAAEPAADETAAIGFVPSSSDGGSFFMSSLTSVFRVREVVVRSPILTAEEYAELEAYWNTKYGLGL